jgi:hypothetical protein
MVEKLDLLFTRESQEITNKFTKELIIVHNVILAANKKIP